MIRRIPLAFYFSSALLYTQAGILPKSDSQPKPPSRLSPGTAVSCLRNWDQQQLIAIRLAL